jgi:molybdenum cofactor cytidylyltransferase
MKLTSLATLFHDAPARWGLRGDPHLWREMRERFEGVECPSTAEALVVLVEEAFAGLTGRPLSHPEPFYVEKYSHGGMSSGYVNPAFWRDTALPLLQDCLRALRVQQPSQSSGETLNEEPGGLHDTSRP